MGFATRVGTPFVSFYLSLRVSWSILYRNVPLTNRKHARTPRMHITLSLDAGIMEICMTISHHV